MISYTIDGTFENALN